MKTLADLMNGEKISPAEVYEIAAANMDPEHIGHYESDLYLKVNSASSIIVGALDSRALLNVFRSQIDGAKWYELPFCFTPWWTARLQKEA